MCIRDSRCDEDGRIIDDVTAYKFGDEHFMIVTSSAPRKRSFRWIADGNARHVERDRLAIFVLVQLGSCDARRQDPAEADVRHGHGKLAIDDPREVDELAGAIDLQLADVQSLSLIHI